MGQINGNRFKIKYHQFIILHKRSKKHTIQDDSLMNYFPLIYYFYIYLNK